MTINKYNQNILVDIKLPQVLQDFTINVLDHLTVVQQKILLLVQNINSDMENDPRTIEFLINVFFVLLCGYILMRLSRLLQRSPKVHPDQLIHQLKQQIRKTRVELDNIKKLLLEREKSKPPKSKKQQLEVNESDLSQKIINHLNQNNNIINNYSQYVNSNNKFNTYFLSILTDIFSELKLLKKNKESKKPRTSPSKTSQKNSHGSSNIISSISNHQVHKEQINHSNILLVKQNTTHSDLYEYNNINDKVVEEPIHHEEKKKYVPLQLPEKIITPSIVEQEYKKQEAPRIPIVPQKKLVIPSNVKVPPPPPGKRIPPPPRK